MSSTDTIAAISTPPGKGGVGIIRVSGARAFKVASDLTQSSDSVGEVHFRKIFHPDGHELDHGVVLYFQSPHSFTGEDVVELQCHGSPVVLDMIMQVLFDLDVRPARPGEFSERAFLNDKMDLTQAEAVADLIDSSSQAAARAALGSLQGQFSSQVNHLVEKAINLRVFVEAALDFAEEEIDFLAESDVSQQLDALIVSVSELLTEAEQGRKFTEGLTIALAGLPNAGKSSLMNYLAGYEAAIVTEMPGTTRDILRESITLRGIPINLIDTAGIRDSDDVIEKEGVRRAWQNLQMADKVLFLIDSETGWNSDNQTLYAELKKFDCLPVITKSDLQHEISPDQSTELSISSKTGEGIDGLVTLLTGTNAEDLQAAQITSARRRHVEALKRSKEHLLQAKNGFIESGSAELMADDLRQVQQKLNEITGEFTADDLLGKIFSNFCIGK